MSRKYTYIFLVVLITSVLYFTEKYVNRSMEHYPNSSSKNKNSSSTEFGEQFYPSSTTNMVIQHDFFRLSYSEAHEQAEWVAYEIRKDQLSQNNIKRPYFVQDKDVITGSADWRNYKNSGYDRGHLCPAADRKFDYDAFHETFLTSNISPQDPKFNGGIWNSLEQKVRFWAKKYDGVFVITGGVLEADLKTIGDESVSVPREFYKIVVDASGKEIKAVAFLIPNRATDRSFYDFAVTIDTIEAKTGIDFFEAFPNSDESKMETTIDLKAWGRR